MPTSARNAVAGTSLANYIKDWLPCIDDSEEIDSYYLNPANILFVIADHEFDSGHWIAIDTRGTRHRLYARYTHVIT